MTLCSLDFQKEKKVSRKVTVTYLDLSMDIFTDLESTSLHTWKTGSGYLELTETSSKTIIVPLPAIKRIVEEK